MSADSIQALSFAPDPVTGMGVLIKRVEIQPLPPALHSRVPRRLATIWRGSGLTILRLLMSRLGVLAGHSRGWTLLAVMVGDAILPAFAMPSTEWSWAV